MEIEANKKYHGLSGILWSPFIEKIAPIMTLSGLELIIIQKCRCLGRVFVVYNPED